MIYSTTLRLSGQFLLFTSPQIPMNINSFIHRLVAKMANLAHNPPAQCKKPTYVSKLFEMCTHVFVREFAWTHSLQPPYRGRFKILKRSKKYFTISIKNCTQNISLDRLKPAFSDTSWINVRPQISLLPLGVSNIPKQSVTRYGRHVLYP